MAGETVAEMVVPAIEWNVTMNPPISASQYCDFPILSSANNIPLCPYCTGEMVWRSFNLCDGGRKAKGWICFCTDEDVVTEATSQTNEGDRA
jgi:hypothetical protein